MTITLTETQAQMIRYRRAILGGVLNNRDHALAPLAAEAERTGDWTAHDEARFDYLEDVEVDAEDLHRLLKAVGL